MSNIELYELKKRHGATINNNCKFHICDSKGIKETKTINYDFYKLSFLYDDKIGQKSAFI
tara:strand:+ start:5151 stop:5330 length:180 start_codon:yes stop_codon:yes gene_type:complete